MGGSLSCRRRRWRGPRESRGRGRGRPTTSWPAWRPSSRRWRRRRKLLFLPRGRSSWVPCPSRARKARVRKARATPQKSCRRSQRPPRSSHQNRKHRRSCRQSQRDAAMPKSERKEAIIKRMEQMEKEQVKREKEKMTEEEVKKMVENVEGKCKTVKSDMADMAMTEQYLRTKQ